ncbi:MAG: DUF6044 family protein [Candidatus Cloacimonetes bacterium]|nr:DUF6044 family protein [Candidatus Cloacimonadota bacterium]
MSANSREEFSQTRFWKVLDNPKVILWLIVLLFIFYFLPYFIKGENVFIPQFDNLDQMSYLGHFDGRFQGHFFLNDQMEEYYLPGMEPVFRLAVISVPKLFWLLGFFRGYVLNEFVYRLLAFLGFYLLLNRYLMKGIPRMFPALISIAYIYLPFWPQGGLSVSGLPLVGLILLNIYHKRQVLLSYIFLLVYIAYSGFFLTGIFVLAILSFLIVIRLCCGLSYKRLIPPLLLMTVIYLITNYPYFLIAFYYKIPTNRSEIQILSKNLADVWKDLFVNYFVTSHKHAPSLHQYLLLPVAIISGYLIIRNRSFFLRKLTIQLLGFIILSALLFSLYRFEPVNQWYTKLQFGFDYSRLFFLNPPVWYLLAGTVITFFYQNYSRKKVILIIALFILIAQITINYYYSSNKTWTELPTYHQVVSENQFDEISNYLSEYEPGFSKSETRIGCVGFQPAVANFNGFKTLGAYCPMYPLHLKQTFLDILEGEMDKNPRLKLYMKRWGSQLYLFDDQIFIEMLDQKYLRSNVKDITCELNTFKLKELGVDYLFSTAKVTNAADKGLREVYREKNPFNYYRFFVYAIE